MVRTDLGEDEPQEPFLLIVGHGGPDVDPDDSGVTAEMRFLGQEPWPAASFDEERRTDDPSA